MNLKNRVAIVTGGASGLGRATAEAFVSTGAKVAIFDLDKDKGESLSESLGEAAIFCEVNIADDAMIEAARTNAARAGATNVEVRKGTIEELPVEDGAADWVISNCVINLSPEKDRVFNEIARVLKPGGRFAISDIVAEDVPDKVRAQADVFSACIGGAISESEYEAGLKSAGLAEVEVAERYVYEASQLREMVGAASRDTGSDAIDLVNDIEAITGKVWSAKFRGRK